jgi:beta-N-acetylhexosaminidase
MRVGRSKGRTIALALAAALVGVTACGGGSGHRQAAPRPTTTVTPTTPASAAPSPSTAPSTTAASQCTNAQMIAAWPLPRRAAQVVVIPALNFDLIALQPTVATGAGGILFLGNSPAPGDLSALVGQVRQASIGGVGPMTMADEEGGGIQRMTGVVDTFPWPRQMAQTMTPAQITAIGARVGSQLRQAGVDMDLAPVLDIDGGAGPSATNADGQRSFSADAATAATDGIAFLDGLREGGVIAVAKHFPGLGGTVGNTDNGAASTPPLATLVAGALHPFEAAIAAGAPAIMVANAKVPGLTSAPASVSPEAVNGLLRQRLGFDRLVLTDSLSAGAIKQFGLGLPEAAVAAIAAGADMVLFGSTLTPAETLLLSPANVQATTQHIVDALVNAVNTSKLSMQRLNEAVSHILATKGINLCAR